MKRLARSLVMGGILLGSLDGCVTGDHNSSPRLGVGQFAPIHDVNLDALGINYKSDFIVRDDGFVEDIDEHAKKVWDELEMNHQEFKESYVGLCITDLKSKKIVYFYLDREDEKNVRARGHEQVHALHNSGKLYLFQNLLDKENLDIDLTNYLDWDKCTGEEIEYVADIGQMYVLYKAGIDIPSQWGRTLNGKISYLNGVQRFKDALLERDAA
jgi:hypothetical protein